MKKVLSVLAAIVLLTAISCTKETISDENQTEQATGKECDGSAGNKDGCPDN